MALGGSGTYTSRGSTYDFALSNTGTDSWQYFSLVAPAGGAFVGGTTSNEGSARCVVGPPTTIVCGPISTLGLASGGRIGFTAVLTTPIACGLPWALSASSDGTSFTRVGDAVFVGSCGPPKLLRPLRVRRQGRLVTVIPPVWSVEPTRVVYVWKTCVRSKCTTVPGVTGLQYRTRLPVHVIAHATFPSPG